MPLVMQLEDKQENCQKFVSMVTQDSMGRILKLLILVAQSAAVSLYILSMN